MAENNIGPRRLVVGAHYGLKDWFIQRITAIVMAIYTFILLVRFLLCSNVSYQGWVALFEPTWFKLLTFIVLLGLFNHVWIGMRDIWMDYVKPVSVRIVLHVATIMWLIGCAAWAIKILWRM